MSTYRLKGTSGAVLNRSFPLEGEHELGPGEASDIHVEGEGEGAWASVQVLDDGSVRLRALGGEPISVNGERVKDIHLAGGDEIRVGRSRFILQAPGLRPERVLTEEATKAPSSAWGWWVVATIAVGGAAAALAWWQGWIPLPVG